MLAYQAFRNALDLFQEGERAFHSQLCRLDAPYREGTREQLAWQAGWDSAEEELRDLEDEDLAAEISTLEPELS